MIRAPKFFIPLLFALLVGSAFLLWRYVGDQTGRAMHQAGSAVAAASRELAKIPAPPEGSETPGVPSSTFALLLQEKHQLRDLIRLTLDSEAPNTSSEQLMKSVSASLSAAGVPLENPVESEAPAQTWGRLSVQVERVLGHKELVAAKVGTSIPCGFDTALYIYEQRGNSWVLALAYESPAYTKIEDAYGALDYAVSPESQNGWYVLTASVTPSCSPGWQQIRYSALRKTNDPYHPKPILGAQARLYEGWDDYWKLKADPDVAQIEWPSLFQLDGNVLIRAHVARYQITNDTATRVAPLALYPEDFLDEWAQAPWDKANEWVAPEALADAEQIHPWLGSSDYLMTMDFLQPCPIPDHWQIGLTVETARGTRPPLQHVYADVSKDGDVFRLDRIAGDRAPGCPGTELLPQRPHSLP